MTDDNTYVPRDQFDLNNYINKYMEDDNSKDNSYKIINTESNYYDIDDLNQLSKSAETTFKCTVLHLNIQSLPAKFDKLKLLITEINNQNIKLDFILLCEAFLMDINANQYNIPGYNLLYKNRTTSNRGGVAIYINSKYTYISRDDISINEPGIFESIFVEIKSNKSNMLIGEIYRIPNTNELSSISKYNTIANKLQKYKHDIIIGTDQNFVYLKIDKHKNTEELLSTFLSNGPVPVITRPTRITHTTATLIDNIYLSKTGDTIYPGIICTKISDHLPIFLGIGEEKKETNKKPLTIQKRYLTDTAISTPG